VSRYTTCAPQARLEVMAAPLEGSGILTQVRAERLLGVLTRTHNLVAADVGSTLAEPATALLLEQAVVVTTLASDAVRLRGCSPLILVDANLLYARSEGTPRPRPPVPGWMSSSRGTEGGGERVNNS